MRPVCEIDVVDVHIETARAVAVRCRLDYARWILSHKGLCDESWQQSSLSPYCGLMLEAIVGLYNGPRAMVILLHLEAAGREAAAGCDGRLERIESCFSAIASEYLCAKAFLFWRDEVEQGCRACPARKRCSVDLGKLESKIVVPGKRFAETSADRLQCIIGTQIYGSGEADIPTMTSDWVIADI